jgi:hypothetical protein
MLLVGKMQQMLMKKLMLRQPVREMKIQLRMKRLQIAALMNDMLAICLCFLFFLVFFMNFSILSIIRLCPG